MAKKTVVPQRDPNRCPTHPGALLREDVLPAVKKNKTEIASLLGISRVHLHDILSERKPVSPEVGLRFAKMFGGGNIWAKMQLTYDTWHAERALAEELKRIPKLEAA